MDQPVNSSDPQPSEQNAGDPGYTENAEKSEQQPESSGSVMAQDAPDAPSDSTPDAVPNEEPAHELVAQSEQQSPDYTEDTSMEDTMQEDEGNQEGETDGVNAVGADASSEQQQQQEQQQQPPAVQETVNTTATNNEPEERIQPANMEIQQEPAQPSNPNPSSFFNTPASWQIPPSALQQRPENEAVNDNTLNKANIRREKLEQRIANDEYDIAAWNSLINEIQQTGDLTATRDIYERFLKIFPTSPKHWLAYLELELSYSNFNEVEALFTRCLKTVLSVDLWKFYLGYIRRINQGDSGTSAAPEARAIIEKAYEYVLNNVGIDKDAGPIWADYIYFMSTAETTNTWEEQRKMDSMRRAYQKAVTIPLNNIEHLWKEYDQWENNLNRLTAKKFLGEKSSAYMTARAALREMKSYLDNINRLAVPKPPQWTDKEVEQLNLWKQYIQWEKKNPLQLEDENLLNERVSYAYQQAFLALRMYPEIWYDYANYYIEQGKQDRALAVLKQSLEVLPSSLLLTFAYTELCETQRQLDDARQAFDSLLEHLEKNIEKHTATAQAEIEKIQKEADEERANMNLSDDIDGEVREQLRARDRQIKKEQDEVENKMKEKIDALSRACSLVWICYMRFARRTEGIKAARALFSRARKATNRTYHVFIASALMEYHNSKDSTVAGKIFGLGLKLFADDAAYVSHYLDFLMQMNDDNNTRALFERTLATMPASKAAPIWDKFLDYENKYGDLASIQSVEKRRSEMLPETAASSFLQRYSYLDIDAIKDLELGGQGSDRVVVVPTATAAVATAAPPPTQKKSKDATKRPLLEPVDVDKYPRPDLSQWQTFKPSELRRPPPVPVSGPPPPPVAPKDMDVDVAPGSGRPATAPEPPVEMRPPPAAMQPVGRPTNAPPPGALPPLPEPVAYFVSNLPPANTFNGPIIKAGELVDLLRNVIIPLPPQGAPPPHGRMPPQPMPPPPGRRDMPGNRGGYSGSPARGRVGGGAGGAPGGGGGFKGRTGAGGGGGPHRAGGKQGTKRRGYDYDDDYQQPKGKKRFGP